VVTVVLGFILGIGLKMYVQLDEAHPIWLEPFQMQAALNWVFVCSSARVSPADTGANQVTDD
jgi:hypothetical protein